MTIAFDYQTWHIEKVYSTPEVSIALWDWELGNFWASSLSLPSLRSEIAACQRKFSLSSKSVHQGQQFIRNIFWQAAKSVLHFLGQLNKLNNYFNDKFPMQYPNKVQLKVLGKSQNVPQQRLPGLSLPLADSLSIWLINAKANLNIYKYFWEFPHEPFGGLLVRATAGLNRCNHWTTAVQQDIRIYGRTCGGSFPFPNSLALLCVNAFVLCTAI